MLLSTSCLILASAFALAAPPENAEGWTPLFNGKDLTGWYTFLQQHGKNADPDKVVTIEDGAIHLYKGVPDGSRVVMGYIATEQEYGDYHLRLQYRWAGPKYEPRYALKRDAGVYYHITGPDNVWPRALQYQIEETNVGDLIALYGMKADTWIDPRTRDAKSPDYPTFLPPDQGGEPRILGMKPIDYQHRMVGTTEREGWNDVEVIAKGARVTHLLNGVVVNRGANVRFDDPKAPGSPVPLTRGRIALEIEAAEMWFRNVEIRPAEH